MWLIYFQSKCISTVSVSRHRHRRREQKSGVGFIALPLLWKLMGFPTENVQIEPGKWFVYKIVCVCLYMCVSFCLCVCVCARVCVWERHALYNLPLNVCFNYPWAGVIEKSLIENPGGGVSYPPFLSPSPSPSHSPSLYEILILLHKYLETNLIAAVWLNSVSANFLDSSSFGQTSCFRLCREVVRESCREHTAVSK